MTKIKVYASPVILVNIRHSVRTMGIREAASGTWYADGPKQQDQLRKARLVLAIAGNTVRGVFRPLQAMNAPHESRETAQLISWKLEDAPAYASLLGHDLLNDGTRWRQGRSQGWIVLPEEEFEELLFRSREDKFAVGPHEVLVRPDGTLEVWVAEGTEVLVHPQNAPLKAKLRIENVVKHMASLGVLATYGAIAQMLGINSAQSVGRSVTRNLGLSPVEAAHVLPHKFQHGNYWAIPMNDPGWHSPSEGETAPQRSEILIKEGHATQNGDLALIEGALVITDGATLRRYLNI